MLLRGGGACRGAASSVEERLGGLTFLQGHQEIVLLGMKSTQVCRYLRQDSCPDVRCCRMGFGWA